MVAGCRLLTDKCNNITVGDESGSGQLGAPCCACNTRQNELNWRRWANRVASRQRAHKRDTNWRGACRNTSRHFNKTKQGTMALTQSLELHIPVPHVRDQTATVQGDSPDQNSHHRPAACFGRLLPRCARQMQPQQLQGMLIGEPEIQYN